MPGCRGPNRAIEAPHSSGYLRAMALLPASHLWPARERAPVLRLGVALIAAPGTVAGLFTLFAFLVAGMTERTSEEVIRVTAQTGLALSLLTFLFTLTFGLAGIALLWRMARRGPVAWALTGGAFGVLAGLLFSTLALSTAHGVVVLAFALAGWAVFLLVRRIAGIRDLPAAG